VLQSPWRRKILSKEDERASKPVRAQLPTDPDQIALIEARNGLKQFDAIREFVRKSIGHSPFKLRPSDILRLNRVALDGLNPLAGVFRPDEMTIGKSRHNPPPPDLVPALVEDMCDYVNENVGEKTPVHLAAYLLWRTNWIHPFDDGNGRTARATSYAVLCICLGYELPGTKTIPEHLAGEKAPYYRALEAADEAWKKKQTDVTELEALLEDALAKQLLEVHEKATGKKLQTDQNTPTN
jgi:Fic family protein